MTHNPQISIIMPVYNAEKYLHESIESILNQSFKDWELVLVDDGSTDSSPEICDEYSAKDSRIHSIRKKNEGVAIARKTGCETATAGHIGFLDSDDTFASDCLMKCNEIINKYDPDILAFGSIWYDEATGRDMEKSLSYEGLYSKEKIKKEIFPVLIQTERAEYYPQSIWSNIYRKECIQPYMIADSRAVVGEDGACVIPAIYHAESIFFLKESLYRYRINTSSVTGGRRVFNWDNPEVTALHIEKNINIHEADFRQQLDRRLCHDIFNVASSRFYSGNEYRTVVSEIRSNLARPLYKEAIKNARFRGSTKATMMMLALRMGLIRLIQAYSRASK